MRLIIAVLLVSSSICSAQEFKKLRVGIGYGRTIDFPAEEQSSSGLLYFEPSYRINDRFAMGFRMEVAATGVIGVPMIGGGSMLIASYGLNAQYYFSAKDFRPFAGGGVGFYKPGVSGYESSRAETTVMGFYPRIGFDYGHLTIMFEYNMAPNSQAILYYNDPVKTGNPEVSEVRNSYGSIKVGLMIGGGRKKAVK